MKSKRFFVALAVALLLAVASGTAWANDQIISTVTIPTGEPAPVIQDNGAVSGNIRLNYTVFDTQWPCGQFAQFNLDLVAQLGTGRGGSYPADLNLAVSGSGTPVQLSPDPSYFAVTGTTWTGSSLVSVYIDCSKVSSSPTDGSTIDGQLNESVTLPGSSASAHINSITTVQVHIKLVFPTSCLKLYSFETNQDTGVLLNSVDVNASGNPQRVRSTSPGQISVDALVANTCVSPMSFDLRIGLDPNWNTNPSGNPGNATFTYTTEGEFDPSTYNLAAFGTGTAQGQSLCLSNVTLPAGDSFLTRVHSAITSGILASGLPGDSTFDFSATLFAPNTTCSGTPLDSSIVGPSNPANSYLAFTVR